ncbi:MAG: KilA-N domain-containing protein [Lentimicrobiaceae bacterium]|nr:KilA-N domain-containing protein [Lentimicrobiaceae bacterium]
MGKQKNEMITVQGTMVAISQTNEENYISLTDIAKYRDTEDPSRMVSLWMRTYSTIEYLGLWETLYNQDFKPHIYEGFKTDSAKPHFWMSPQKWTKETNAKGIISKPGRYGGGTFAHPDIAFKFASWVSAEFELYLIKEFQRLKSEEQQRLSLEWNLQRTLAKINYRIHTDAIKEQIIPPEITKEQAGFIYSSEADLLNVALFGKTAAQWRATNPELDGNIRDHATLEQLVVLSNLESVNAVLIREGLEQGERLIRLNQIAITQLTSLLNSEHIKRLRSS